ncbi:hypothetical protein [uncultured Gammaproteobacteria bacterium]|nr:hypothetical protein [uncultured Gammaproteobacteria bacterium]SMN15329.1 hypothetical protein CRYPD_480 [uncultured Candidatus Thioglobus sp.]
MLRKVKKHNKPFCIKVKILILILVKPYKTLLKATSKP